VKRNLAQDLAFGNRYDAALKIYEQMAADDRRRDSLFAHVANLPPAAEFPQGARGGTRQSD